MELVGISVEEARRRVDEGEKLYFVDARRASDWQDADQKLPGALRVSPENAKAHVNDLPGHSTIVIYCECPAEEASREVAEIFRRFHRKNVYVLEGGFEAWLDAGHPTDAKLAPADENTQLAQG
jgi:rhodanese-related sulfurtransferase